MDKSLFIDIIESIKGITFIRREFSEGVHIHFYEGLTGKLVIIDTTDDEISEDVCKAHLNKLGLEYLIPTLFNKN